MSQRSALKRFGSYALLARLAKGGMGEVFVARHGDIAGMQKLCVVKTLRADMSRDDDYAARFFDEARLVVQLSHRNVCQVFDVGRVGERFYLGMELVAGTDLRALIDDARARGAGLPEPLAIFIGVEMLEALSYAHRLRDPVTGASLKVVHRDVSPQNVMVSFEGEVKLIDFGLAASTLKRQETQVNRVMGKLAYMPPEQARGDDVDERADIFAAAVVLVELLTGLRYYEGMTHDQVWNVAGRGTYRAPALDRLHKGLRKVLEEALAPDPTTRTATAEAFREGLEAYAFARGFRPTPADVRAYLKERFPDAQDAHRALVAEVATISSDEGTPMEASQSLLQTPGTPRAAQPSEPTGGAAPARADDAAVERSADDSIHTADTAVKPLAPVATPVQPELVVRGGPPEPRARAQPALSGPLIAAAVVGGALFIALVAAVVVVASSDDAPAPPPPVAKPELPPPVLPVLPVVPALVDAGTAPVVDEPAPPPTTTKRPPRPRPKRVVAPASTAPLDERLAFLRAHCPTLPCARSVLGRKVRTTWTIRDKYNYNHDVSSCVEVCAP